MEPQSHIKVLTTLWLLVSTFVCHVATWHVKALFYHKVYIPEACFNMVPDLKPFPETDPWDF